MNDDDFYNDWPDKMRHAITYEGLKKIHNEQLEKLNNELTSTRRCLFQMQEVAIELTSKLEKAQLAMESADCAADIKIGVAELSEKHARENLEIAKQALEFIRNELGVPQPDYPAPISYAAYKAREALEKLK